MLRRSFIIATVALAALPAVAAQEKPLVLLAGATGKNGSVILEQLQTNPDFRVRAMTRDAAAATAKFGNKVEWVEADVTKPETLGPALKGVTYVINAVAASNKDEANFPVKVDLEGTRNLAAAAKKVGVKRFVIITSSVSGQVDNPMNKRGNDVIIYKGKAEEALIASGVPYTIVGPAGMNSNPGGVKSIVLVPRSEYKMGQAITRADTATVAIAALTNPDAANKAFSVSNGDGPGTPAKDVKFAGLPAK